VLLIVALVVLLNGSLVVLLRPDLCPRSSCDGLHALAVRELGKLGLGGTALGGLTQSPLSAAPESVALQTAAGSSGRVSLTLTNTGGVTSDWSATVTPAWLTINPAQGTLDAGAGTPVTLTASPGAGVQPGTYNAAIAFTTQGTTLSVPVVVTISATP
jgi:hypothetical protein